MSSERKLILTKMLVSLVFGIALGGVLLLINEFVSASSLIKWAIIIAGIVITVANVPSLISGIVNVSEKEGLVELILSAVGVLMGLVMIFMHNSVITIIFAVYLIIIPVVEIILSKDRINTLKGEWLRILIGALLIAFLPALFGAADKIFNIILTISGWVIIAITAISFGFSLYGFLKAPKTVAPNGAEVVETTAEETVE